MPPPASVVTDCRTPLTLSSGALATVRNVGAPPTNVAGCREIIGSDTDGSTTNGWSCGRGSDPGGTESDVVVGLSRGSCATCSGGKHLLFPSLLPTISNLQPSLARCAVGSFGWVETALASSTATIAVLPNVSRNTDSAPLCALLGGLRAGTNSRGGKSSDSD